MDEAFGSPVAAWTQTAEASGKQRRLHATNMPELPEVETVVRGLAPRLAGRRITKVIVRSSKPWRYSAQRLRGRRILAVKRYGKYVLLELDRGWGAIHLGMTGRLTLDGERNAYSRAIFELDEGRLLFDDVRQFGFVRWALRPPRNLGPDALEISEEEFVQRLLRRGSRLKSLLLDQSFVAGVGNIYADESLFRAGLHPLRKANELSLAQAKKLFRAMRQVLAEAIEKGGSTVESYANAEGQPGWFQLEHRVYRKTGQPCQLCGARIRRILVGQRSTHFCPQCQPAP